MKLPKPGNTCITERIGVNKVASILTEMGWIFRETSNSDTGIDGHVEELDENFNATGRIMAVQIKSGKSYLHNKVNGWKYYVDETHKNYWRIYPLPVMLLVHNPDDGNVYFVDAKYALNSIGEITIPKRNILCLENKDEFMKTIGGCVSTYSDIDEVFNVMLKEQFKKTPHPVSYLELFVLGLTNLCHDLFYDVSILIKIVRTKSENHGVSLGDGFHDFLWGYIVYLVKENLAEINFHACLHDYENNNLQPRFIAPLTYRGRELSKYVSKLEQQYLEESNVQIVDESIVELKFDHNSVLRLGRLTELQSLLIAKMGQTEI